jgi:hypothetical protein
MTGFWDVGEGERKGNGDCNDKGHGNSNDNGKANPTTKQSPKTCDGNVPWLGRG